jgi:hypothetical protein
MSRATPVWRLERRMVVASQSPRRRSIDAALARRFTEPNGAGL